VLRQGAAWRYWKGAAAPPAEWAGPGFDDKGWPEGESGFGFSSDARELASVKTKLADMLNRYLTLHIRAAFRLPEGAKVEKLTLKVLCDDGFVAYIDGEEVGRENVDGAPPRFDAPAKIAIEPKEIERA
jgi:hypothetical protein